MPFFPSRESLMYFFQGFQGVTSSAWCSSASITSIQPLSALYPHAYIVLNLSVMHVQRIQFLFQAGVIFST